MKGPFSSRAGVINKVGEQHPDYDWGPVLDVRYKQDLDALTPKSGAATLDTCEDAIDRYLEGEDVELVRTEKFSGNEPYYAPRNTGDLE